MSDKKQLAAMGEHLSEQPLCMAKRIEELEAQVRVMAELLRDARKYVTALGKPDDEVSAVQMTVSRIDALLAGQVPAPAAAEGWQLVPMEPTERMISESIDAGRFDEDDAVFFWASMLAAAPTGRQMTFAEALASAEAQYQQQRAAYVAALSPEQLEAIQSNAEKPRPIGRRITIERERGDVVYRSQCPYVGLTTITSKKNGRL